MALSNHEKVLIQTTFTQIALHADVAAEIFYGRLFEISPDTMMLFATTDMRKQGRKLMQTIAMAVGAIRHLDTLIPAVEALARRHIEYGVRKEQYVDVGEALIWTLEQVLREEFTIEVKKAWTKVYTLFAATATRAYDVQPSATLSSSVQYIA